MTKIFIVDDEPAIQFFLKEILILFGFEIAGIANNGEKAVSLFKSFSDKPKVILMDHRMPIKNGIEATKEILQIDKSVKIIFTSPDEDVKEEALAIGAFSFKEKPFNIECLINNINDALEYNSLSI